MYLALRVPAVLDFKINNTMSMNPHRVTSCIPRRSWSAAAAAARCVHQPGPAFHSAAAAAANFKFNPSTSAPPLRTTIVLQAGKLTITSNSLSHTPSLPHHESSPPFFSSLTQPIHNLTSDINQPHHITDKDKQTALPNTFTTQPHRNLLVSSSPPFTLLPHLPHSH